VNFQKKFVTVIAMEHRLVKAQFLRVFKKVKDAPLLERMKFIHGENKELDKKATQAAREAGAEERREARGMKKGGMVKSSASKRADGIAKKGKTRGKMV
jgi:hypothetical protein